MVPCYTELVLSVRAFRILILQLFKLCLQHFDFLFHRFHLLLRFSILNNWSFRCAFADAEGYADIGRRLAFAFKGGRAADGRGQSAQASKTADRKIQRFSPVCLSKKALPAIYHTSRFDMVSRP